MFVIILQITSVGVESTLKMPLTGKVLAAINCANVYIREPDNGPRCLLSPNYECYTNALALRQSSNMRFSPLSSTPTLERTVSR
jgi:hypothetical protein